MFDNLENELLQESMEIEYTYRNLCMEIINEEDQSQSVGNKIMKWSIEQKAKISKTTDDTVRNVKKLVKAVTYDRKFYTKNYLKTKKVRILEDRHAFTNMAKVVEGSRTMKIALYNAQKIVNYANYSINAEMAGRRINKLYRIIQKELEGPKFNYARTEINNFAKVVPEENFVEVIEEFVSDMIQALERFQQMIYAMGQSIQDVAAKQTWMKKKLDHVKLPVINKNLPMTKKLVHGEKLANRDNLILNILAVVGYANKLLTTSCVNMIKRIEGLIGQFTNIKNEKINKNNEIDENIDDNAEETSDTKENNNNNNDNNF